MAWDYPLFLLQYINIFNGLKLTFYHTITVSHAKTRRNHLFDGVILPIEYHKRQVIYHEIALLFKKN